MLNFEVWAYLVKLKEFFKVPFIVTPKIVVELFRLQKISFKKEPKSSTPPKSTSALSRSLNPDLRFLTTDP